MTRTLLGLTILFFCVACGSGGGGNSTPPAAPATHNDLLINEVDPDTSGTDTLEFVELYNAGASSLDLSGTVLVFYNGATNAVYMSFDLDGHSVAARSYFVVGNAAVANVDVFFADNSLQNGADAVALYVGDSTDFPNGEVAGTAPEEMLDALVYDTSDADNTILIAALTPAEAQIDNNAALTKDTTSMQRIPNGTGGARKTGTYANYLPTPGTENAAVDPLLAPAPIVARLRQ